MSKTVLIVEDEFAQRKALQDKLTQVGFELLTARNGDEGLATAFTKHPDIIILDVMMPKMDGIDMVKKLRDDTWGSSVPVLLLTNLDDMETIQKAIENGVYEYFIKSETTIDQIVKKVEEMVGGA